MHIQHMSIQLMSVFTIKQGFHKLFLLLMFQCNEHIYRMNKLCVVSHAPG